MIFILFFLSAGFVFISHGLDKFSMSKHVSEKHFPTIQFIAKLFIICSPTYNFGTSIIFSY